MYVPVSSSSAWNTVKAIAGLKSNMRLNSLSESGTSPVYSVSITFSVIWLMSSVAISATICELIGSPAGFVSSYPIGVSIIHSAEIIINDKEYIKMMMAKVLLIVAYHRLVFWIMVNAISTVIAEIIIVGAVMRSNHAIMNTVNTDISTPITSFLRWKPTIDMRITMNVIMSKEPNEPDVPYVVPSLKSCKIFSIGYSNCCIVYVASGFLQMMVTEELSMLWNVKSLLKRSGLAVDLRSPMLLS